MSEVTRCYFVAMTNLKILYWLYSKNSIEVRVILHQAAAKSQFYENWLVLMNFDFMDSCHNARNKSGWLLSDVGFKVILWPDFIVSIGFFSKQFLYIIYMDDKKSFVIKNTKCSLSSNIHYHHLQWSRCLIDRGVTIRRYIDRIDRKGPRYVYRIVNVYGDTLFELIFIDFLL